MTAFRRLSASLGHQPEDAGPILKSVVEEPHRASGLFSGLDIDARIRTRIRQQRFHRRDEFLVLVHPDLLPMGCFRERPRALAKPPGQMTLCLATTGEIAPKASNTEPQVSP